MRACAVFDLPEGKKVEDIVDAFLDIKCGKEHTCYLLDCKGNEWAVFSKRMVFEPVGEEND